MSETDCVIGCFDLYSWSKVRVWAKSLAASGFRGARVAIIRATTQECRSQLAELGFEIVDIAEESSAIPHVARLEWVYRYLQKARYEGREFRWVMFTDVRDVLFQRNPSDYLDSVRESFVFGSEGLKYADEKWGMNNIRTAFGDEIYQILSQEEIFNVGVLAGKHKSLEGLCLMLHQIARSTSATVVDQAGFNLLCAALRGALSAIWSGCDQPWVCHAGTVADPSKMDIHRPKLLYPEPIWQDGKVCTHAGEPFYIVHQYDRVPQWNAKLAGLFA